VLRAANIVADNAFGDDFGQGYLQPQPTNSVLRIAAINVVVGQKADVLRLRIADRHLDFAFRAGGNAKGILGVVKPDVGQLVGPGLPVFPFRILMVKDEGLFSVLFGCCVNAYVAHASTVVINACLNIANIVTPKTIKSI
jgi:hypothetical protein